MIVSIDPGSTLIGVMGSTGCPNIPGDKSLSHRAALFAAMAEGESLIENFQDSGVTRVMLDSLTNLGVLLELNGDTLHVSGAGGSGYQSPEVPLYCGNSATTLRLLTGSLAADGVKVVLDGSEGLRRRPMGRIVDPLREMGVPIHSSENGTAPLEIAARPSTAKLKAMTYTLPVSSAQVKSCLILAALAADGVSYIREPELSRDHTERMLASMGVEISSGFVEISGKHLAETRVSPIKRGALSPLNITLPGDTSAAAFLIVAALITPGSCVTIPNVGLNPTRTGLLDALRQMGGDIAISGETSQAGEKVGIVTAKYSQLSGNEIAGEMVVRMIDEFPVFAVAAAYARGKTIVRDAAELRYKESDRIGKLCGEMQKLGIDIKETEDGFCIIGTGMVKGGEARSFGDHRLAMSLMVAGLGAAGGVTVDGAEMAAESFPEFRKILQFLGAKMSEAG